MGTKEWAVILAAIITAAATLISVMIDNNEAQLTPIINPTNDKINIPAENLLPSIRGLTSSETDPQYAGENVHWEASAYDPENDQLFYKFLVNGEDQTDWATEKTWTWDNTEDYIGDNQIDVRVRDGKHTDPNNFDDHKSVKFTIMEASEPESEDSHDYEEDTETSRSPYETAKRISDLGAYRHEGATSIEYDELASMKVANIEYNKGMQIYSFYGTGYYYWYFNLNGEYSRLTGHVGMDDRTKFKPDVTVTFFGDDVEIYAVTVSPGDFPVPVDIDVNGVHKLTIRGTEIWDGSQYLDLIDMELKKE